MTDTLSLLYVHKVSVPQSAVTVIPYVRLSSKQNVVIRLLCCLLCQLLRSKQWSSAAARQAFSETLQALFTALCQVVSLCLSDVSLWLHNNRPVNDYISQTVNVCIQLSGSETHCKHLFLYRLKGNNTVCILYNELTIYRSVNKDQHQLQINCDVVFSFFRIFKT